MSDKKTMGWAHLIRGGSLGKVSQAAMSALGASCREVLNKPMLQHNGPPGVTTTTTTTTTTQMKVRLHPFSRCLATFWLVTKVVLNSASHWTLDVSRSPMNVIEYLWNIEMSQ